jgi:hypothetical protein
VIASVLVLAACGRPPAGTDGDLTDQWPAMPETTHAVPAVGACYPFLGFKSSTTSLEVGSAVSCKSNRSLEEAAYVGSFTGADAELVTTPGEHSQARRRAYEQCQRGASEYLGGDWHTASVWLTLVVPTETAWRGGVRWFRCDLAERYSPFSRIIRGPITSMKDGLRRDRGLEIDCLTPSNDFEDDIELFGQIECDRPHWSQLAGVYTVPDQPWPASNDSQRQLGVGGCRDIVARFLGFPNAAAWRNNAIGFWWTDFDEERWRLGDRSTLCFAYALTASKRMVGTVRGIGTGRPRES